MKVAFVEIVEKEVKAHSGNLAFALFKNDLENKGHHCDIIRIERKLLFSPILMGRFYNFLKSKNYDLIGLNTSSAYPLVNAIKDILKKPKIVIGGINSVNLLEELFNEKIDYICHGPGRATIVKLVESIEKNKNLEGVPNLIFKRGGRIVHSKTIESFDLERETRDFKPRFDSIDFGFKEELTKYYIIGDFGCPYKKSVEENPFFEGVEFKFDFDLNKCDSVVRSVVRQHLELAKKGCSFCSISSDRDYSFTRKTRKVKIILKQIKILKKMYGSSNIFSLIDEAPLTYLPSLIKRLEDDEENTMLAINNRADHLLAYKKEIEKIINQSKKVTLILGMVGFENFSQKELDIFNKGTTVTQNLEALKYIKKLEETSRNFRVLRNFGIILFNPWTTIEDLKQNIRVFEEEDFIRFIGGNSILRTLHIDKNSAIYFKALKDGLLTKESTTRGGFVWKFKDKRVEKVHKNCGLLFKEKRIPLKQQLEILKAEVNKFI